METRSSSPPGRAGIVALTAVAMAGLCLAIALCAMSAVKVGAPVKTDTIAVELKIRESGGYWHWLVFQRYACGIEPFDRFEAEFYVNEYSALDRSKVAALEFVIDGKAFRAAYRHASTVPGAKSELAYVLHFSLDLACVRALERGKSIVVRTLDSHGDFVDYSVPEPERFHQAMPLLF